ncbi:hypothetical protein EVG20_g2351 [Dentipellis fragilis]|uniref:REM-1 domain-containing protein n=1 Tax=Dentipellis fragilis TaxID=205917 RepID=A0A4Y9ZA43_9AGAM|nr:hypothetical protein EVG20_g2351 [Dentipellis fragilis]
MMGTAKSIKEGAEAILNDPNSQLKDTLRAQVETEKQMANSRLDAIAQRIDLHRRVTDDRGMSQVHSVLMLNSHQHADDFRSVLQQASVCIKTLASIGRSAMSPVPSPSSSSTPQYPTPNESETTRMRTDAMTKLTGTLQRNLRVRYELDVAQVAQAVIPALSDRSSEFCRATAYRLIRHTLVDTESVKRLHEQPLDWYIVKSLTLDLKHTVEKEQVIKLIRAIVEIGSQRSDPHSGPCSGNVPLSDAVMRAFIAVAEQPEDPFKSICILTLAEILLIDIDLVSRTGGIRVLLHSLAEGPLELASLLTPVFLHIVDSPRTRGYLRPGTDLEMALSGVTDAYGKDPTHADRLKGICRLIGTMLRTWSGLMYFCMDDMQAIRALVDTLQIPSLDTREVVLDMFFDLLNIKTPEWYQTFINGRRLTMYHKARPGSGNEKTHQQELPQRSSEPLKLTDQYIGLLILVLCKAGLLDALTNMFQENPTGSNLSRKATLLMAEPIAHAPLRTSKLIPHVFDLALDYQKGEHRIIGTSALSSIDSFNRNRARLQPSPANSSRPRANSVEDAIRRGQRQVEQVKVRMGLQMDDRTFQAALLETQVMLTKDHNKWNFETLQDLIEGPLLNPKRMEEAIKVSRFIRRLMSFFHPFSHRFSDIERWNWQSNQRWVKMGCTLLSTLMASPDGQRFLGSEDDFLRQIVRSFAQLDPFNGTPESDPIFSKKRVSDTLTYGYLEMLGTLSKYKEGIELMEKFKVFTAFYHLSELRSREDLIKGIIENIDYSIDGHPRIVLSKALTSSYKHIRLYATNHLGIMIKNSTSANAWTLRLLITQLYDPAMDVCEMAARYLEEACESMDILRLVVAMQPTLDHLGEIGHGLLLKFMSTPMGFRYLYDAGYIDREMDLWFHERNIHYVVQIEVYLAKAFGSIPVEDEDDLLTFDGLVPQHFYGEIAKTELGYQVLREKGHFAEFVHFIRQHGLENEDTEVILKLKSILWTVGNIGSTTGGLRFLEEEEIIPVILEIAEQSLVLSVRGTCFFVLGLISSTPQGAEILDDYHWEATLSPLGLPTGLCIPVDIEKFVSIPPWEPASCIESDHRLIPPTSQAELEVLTAISNLSNTVIANTASRTLSKLKSKSEYKTVFSSPAVFFRALDLISSSHYRLPVRRYIFDLFDVDLEPDVVKQMAEYAKTFLVTSPKTSRPAHAPRAVSVFFAAPRQYGSESDEEEEIAVKNRPKIPTDAPVVSLRPKSMVVGFAEGGEK